MTNTPEIISISDDDTPILLDDLPVVVSESKRSVVPIDGKNYDVEITSIISNRNCFGMVKLPIFILYNLDHIVKAYMGVFKNLSNKSIIYFTFPPERGSNLEVKQHLAELNESHSQLLIALVQHNVVFESYLDFRHSVAKMLVYGRKLDASFIGNSFLMAGLTLLPPDVQPKEVYINPQTTLPQMMPRTGANQVPGLLVDQIDQLYKQITRSDNLETAEPSALVTTKLYKYQKQGLFWLKKQESAQEDVFWKKKGLQWEHVVTGTIRHTRPKKFRGGILADDMGLGKTLQMISLLLSSRPSINMEICSDEDELPAPAANSKYEFGFVPLHKSTCKNDDDENIGKFRSTGTLIICPLSLVYNWEQQIIDHSVPGSLKVLVYHGPQRSQDASSFLNYDVVITTYNIIGLNLSKGTSALHQVHWHRIILDEAHVIKSTTAAQSKAAILFKATNRWCLTGTPIQNKLDDLYSLVKFLRISPLDKKSEFSTYITKPANTGKRAAAFKRLQILMKGMTLRRVKTDTINGIPIISLPPKRETVRILSLDKEERTFYDKIHRAGKTLFNDLRDSGAVLKNYATILKAILLMRQACLHQSLPKFIESEFDTNVVLSRLCDLDAEEAKKAFHLLRSIDENTCMKCQSIVEAPGIYVSPCRHLLCCNCRESASKYELIGCGLCGAQTSANQLLQVKDEEEYASDDEMGGMLATSNVNDYGTKIAALVDDIKLVQAEDAMRKGSATKSVIFSQFTKFLSLCERALKESGITFVRLDGSMNRQARSTVLDKFRNDPGMSCFLISIKAGGVGLNLVSASRVYVMEPYWNPAVEQQAIDRVYRLGQTKPVIVIRYLVESSIEMNMQQRQRYKIALAEKALTEDELITENRNKKRKAANDVILNEKIESLSILFRTIMLTALGIFVAIIAVLLSFVNFLGPKIVFESDYLFSRVDRNEPFDKECEGRPRRNRKEGKDLLSHPAGITSLHDNFLKGCRTSGDRPLFGTRTIVNGVAGEYQFETYNQVYDKVMMIASGLKDMGITELANIGLYSVNRAEWVIAEHACYAGNWVTVPLYDTLGDEALQYIINLTEMQAIFCSADRIPKLLKNQGSLLSVKSVVLMNHGALDEESLKEIKKASFTVYSFEEVMAKGRNKPMTRVATNLDSVATICFTSGTTGMPKGAIITHGNILSFVAGIEYLGESGAGPLFSKDEVHLSFLPLAHIFERCVQAVLFYYGSVIGFYQGDTLKLLDDVQILKPTIFVAVPRLFNRIHEKVMGNVNAAGGLKKKLFMYAYGVKKANLKKGTVVHKLWDNLIFKQVKNRLGGRVKFMITGSAPISDEVINFLRICFSAYVCEGYGQTETSAGATTTNPYDLTTGHIGQPMPQCMVKLRDVPAMNYTSKDKPYPRGEICIKGNNVFKGYYKDPEKTAETLVNGWNFTGDVGMWDSQGRLLIIDRVKNIFKLSQGEYIAPDRLESVFAHFPAIAQSFVYGDSLQSTLVAVIVPGEGFEIWANKAGFSGKTSELIKSKQVKEQLLIDMAKFGRDHGLKGFELIKNLHFELVPFSIENNLLSPSFKAKRFELKLRYQKELNLLYAEMQ